MGRASASPYLVLMILLAGALLPARIALALEGENAAHELLIGTKEAPPLAIKDENGAWKGLSIDLWRHIADRLKLRYRFVETDSVSSLLDGLGAHEFDVAIAAISVTAAREEKVDFTVPYLNTGSGVAVHIDRIAGWGPVIRSMISFSFVQATAALLGLALGAGALIWLFERNRNEGFSGGVARGISSGVWWSTNIMTQRVSGGAVPLTLPGRMVAMVWMVVSMVAIAIFTAGLTSALTTKRLHGAVNTVTDLSGVRVGTVEHTESEDTLTRMRIFATLIASPQEGLRALQDGTIDALVYDRPILAWLIRESRMSSVELTDVKLDPQDYAIALPAGSALRKPLNVALLETIRSDWWNDRLFRYLGRTKN
jgi:polar amino acid transport system substrate-binding protein